MTVYELLQALSDLEPDMEVRLMTQESWPFEDAIRGVWEPESSVHRYQKGEPDEDGMESCLECGGTDDEYRHDAFQPKDPPEAGVVYLVQGTQLGYGAKEAWNG